MTYFLHLLELSLPIGHFSLLMLDRRLLVSHLMPESVDSGRRSHHKVGHKPTVPRSHVPLGTVPIGLRRKVDTLLVRVHEVVVETGKRVVEYFK